MQAAGWPIWPLIWCSVRGLAFIFECVVARKTARVAPPRLLDETITVSFKALPPPHGGDHSPPNLAPGECLAAAPSPPPRQGPAPPRCGEPARPEFGPGRSAGQRPARPQQQPRVQRNRAARSHAKHRAPHRHPHPHKTPPPAPWPGLLGPVIGMIEIFGSQAGPGDMGQAIGGSNPAMLAHGISTALYNTAFGLIVAIPALIFWRYFRARVDAYLLTLELAAEQFVHHMLQLRQIMR